MVRQYIHGLHEPGGEHLMATHPGFILFTHELGRDPGNHNGFDYTPWTSQGFQVIARLNHGYGAAGTIPLPAYYADFAQRVENFVANSAGCFRWIIGNEPNHSQERPTDELDRRQPITPMMYAECFNMAGSSILSIAGHRDDIVIPAPVAVWNVETTYPENPSGDWLKYFTDQLNYCAEAVVGGIALHTYTHGSDPMLITSEQMVDPPYQDRRYHFRAYQDFMAVIPEWYNNRPVYITETNQNGPWLDVDNGWIQGAMAEIDGWNQMRFQTIEACICYRWPRYDQWYMDGLGGVMQGFQEAANLGYYVDIGDEPMPEPIEVLENGGMEEPYTHQLDSNGHPMMTIKVPEHWTAYWLGHMPEYKPAERELHPDRVHSGARAAQWFANYARPNGGLYQTVPTVPGRRYRLSGFGQLWCIYDNGNDVPASLETRVSPYGSTNVDDPRNLRSAPIHPHNRWLPFNDLEFVARSDLSTIFILGIFVDPGRDMNAYVDTFSLQCLDCGEDPDCPDCPDCPPPGEGTCDPVSSGAAGLALATARSLLVFADAATEASGFFQELLDQWIPKKSATLLERIKVLFNRQE